MTKCHICGILFWVLPSFHQKGSTLKEESFLGSIPAVAKFFGLGAVRAITPAGGEGNANFFVDTHKGQFFIKIVLEPHTPANKLNEVVYVNHAADYGVPCVPYLAGRDRQFVYNEGGVMAMAQRRVIGSHPLKRPENVYKVSRQLGKMHCVPFSSLPHRYGWFSPEYIEKNLARMRVEFAEDPGGRAILEAYESCEGFINNVLPNLPRSIIHGDAHSENVLFRGRKFSAFIDWEEVTVGPSLLDYAISASDLCFFEDTFRPLLYLAFHRGYTRERPLTVIELRHINDCMRYVGVVQTIWRFLTFGREASLRGLKLSEWRAPNAD